MGPPRAKPPLLKRRLKLLLKRPLRKLHLKRRRRLLKNQSRRPLRKLLLKRRLSGETHVLKGKLVRSQPKKPLRSRQKKLLKSRRKNLLKNRPRKLRENHLKNLKNNFVFLKLTFFVLK